MGACCVKQQLTEEDITFLKKHTRYDEETIRDLVFNKFNLGKRNVQFLDNFFSLKKCFVLFKLKTLFLYREWYAGFLQDCPNGKLTPNTFCEMYKMFFPSGDADKFCENVFRTFDADKSGTIDFKEFLMAIDVTSAGTPREKLLWAFRFVLIGLRCELNSIYSIL